jgi:hypothetical protein
VHPTRTGCRCQRSSVFGVTIIPLPASRRQEPSKRREKSAISYAERRPRLLSMEHRKLMAQNNQLDVLGELTVPASDEQPQQRGKHEVNKGKEHPPILPKLAATDIKRGNWF